MVQKALSGYVVSLARLHEWGFDVPAGDFIRALCHYYGVIANFNRRRVLPRRERKLPLFKMTKGAPSYLDDGGAAVRRGGSSASGASGVPAPEQPPGLLEGRDAPR